MRFRFPWHMFTTAVAGILFVLTVLPAPVDAAPITWEVIFTGTAPLPSGTITFDNSDPQFPGLGTVVVPLADLVPYSFSFTDGISTWTEADFLDTSIPGTESATFVDGDLFGLYFRVYDTAAPGDGVENHPLFFVTSDTRIWRAEPAFGTYSIEPASTGAVPEPGTILLLGSGLAAVAARRYHRRA